MSNNRAGGSGGAIWSSGQNSLTVVNTIVSYNTAEGNGGGIFVGDAAAFTMTGGVVRKNSTSSSVGGSGGGIYLGSYNGLDTTISGVQVSDNDAWQGGGIYSNRSLYLSGCTDIHDNWALGGRGGGVFLEFGTITYAAVSIGNNTATVGDGVYRSKGTSRAGEGDYWYGDPVNTETVGT